MSANKAKREPSTVDSLYGMLGPHLAPLFISRRYTFRRMMTANANDLLATLRGEVNRIVEETTANDKSDELEELLLLSINNSLHEIKMGADSEEFQDLTMINFVINADDAGYSVPVIHEFVKELKSVRAVHQNDKEPRLFFKREPLS